MAQRGKKECPGCKELIGARTLLCGCGYHYPSGKIRKDLLKAKADEVNFIKAHKTEGRGRKRCPKCDLIVGARVKTCSCGFDFSLLTEKRAEEKKTAAKKEKPEKKEEKIKPLVAECMRVKYEEPPQLSKRDHAKRILKSSSAKVLALLHRNNKSMWSHVDWDYVEQRLVS